MEASLILNTVTERDYAIIKSKNITKALSSSNFRLLISSVYYFHNT